MTAEFLRNSAVPSTIGDATQPMERAVDDWTKGPAEAIRKAAESMIDLRMAGQSTAVSILIGATLEMMRNKGLISTDDVLGISN